MKTEILIVGSGMVGMSLAHQLKKKSISNKITIIEKELDIGKHSSGRNSGVLHAGVYYKPNSLKAKVCIEGAKMLKSWVKDNDLSIYNCGKIIVPQEKFLDSQLDILYERGKTNGANIQFISSQELEKKIPFSRTASGRALWSPETSVVNPIEILKKLEFKLNQLDVELLKGIKIHKIDSINKNVFIGNNKKISYEYLFNCAGLNSIEIAKYFDIAENYILIPFKGLYWELKPDSPFKIKTNLYPVPDINIPFLGVHFTPSCGSSKVTIGPTATLALGKENYEGLKNIEIAKLFRNISIISYQYLKNNNGFRNYVHEQLPLGFEPFLINSAKKLIPNIKKEHISFSKKVGIRSQLFDKKDNKLVDDFLCVNTSNSTHILNAISPAFTASFALANLIINNSNL